MENQNIGLISLLNGIMNHNVIIRTELINIPTNHPVQPNQTNRGCSEEFLNNLEEFRVDEEFLKRNLQCSICLEDLKLNDECIILNCNEDKHIFHKGNEHCSGIKPWLERNNTCPMCRCEFETEDIQSQSQINSMNTFPSIFNIQDNSVDISDNNIINDSEDYITNITEMIINEVQTIRDEERNFQRAIELSLEDVE